MDVRPSWTDCDEARDYVVPNVFSPRDLVSRPDNMDETVPHQLVVKITSVVGRGLMFLLSIFRNFAIFGMMVSS